MPITVKELFKAVGLNIDGQVKWGARIPCSSSGVYVASLSDNPDEATLACLKSAPIDVLEIKNWMEAVPKLLLDGNKPHEENIRERLSRFWLPDENIVYIGKARQPLNKRVNAYYNTSLGKSGPHRGGFWIKTLSNLSELTIFWSPTTEPEIKEGQMLEFFIRNVSVESMGRLFDPSHPFPFANLEYPKGKKKKHGIKYASI